MLTTPLLTLSGAILAYAILSAIPCAAVMAAEPAAVPLSCPPSISIAAAQATPPALGWKVHVASDLYLNSATPISGPPEMRGELADYTTRPGRHEWSYIYDLDRDFSDGKWLECGYGTHNEMTLSQRLPDAIKTCTFTYRKGEKAGQHHIRIDCR